MAEILHVSPDGLLHCVMCGVPVPDKSFVATVELRDERIANSVSGYWTACASNAVIKTPSNRLIVNDPFLRELLAECIKVLDTKGADYTAGNLETDRLHNFRTVAAETGISMEKAWYVYFYKHASSIKRFVKDGYVESEPLRGRVVDLINYLYLLLRIEEAKKASGEPKP